MLRDRLQQTNRPFSTLTGIKSLQAAPESCVTVAMRSRKRLRVAQAPLTFARQQLAGAQIVLTAALVLVHVAAQLAVLFGQRAWHSGGER